MPADYVDFECRSKNHVFLQLLGARHLDAGLVRRIDNIRNKGTAAKLHLALDSLPEFKGLDANHLGHRLLIARISITLNVLSTTSNTAITPRSR